MEQMTDKLQVLKESVRGLSGSELDQLVNYCLLQKQTSSPGERTSILFYQAMEFVLRKIGYSLPPLPTFLKLKIGKEYPTQVAKVETFLKGLGARPNTWDRANAYRLLIQLMAEDVQRIPIPLGPKTLLEAVDRLPSIFEDAFPGYIASGLAWRVLQKNS